MYKNIVTISKEEIESVAITAKEKYEWVDTVLSNKQDYVLPVKTRMPLKETDYFNVMPCALPSENILGLKVVTRNENRRSRELSNIDGDILLYSYEDFLPIALMDGSLITTIRTAAVAVHTMFNFTPKEVLDSPNLKIAMVGLGNIGTEIGGQLFELLCKHPKYTVKLFEYKDHADRFVEKFKNYSNIQFERCSTYDELMSGSDVVFSSVTYMDSDFCQPSVYKHDCTVIPVHLRGFMECDRCFDHVITSDLESIKKFRYYGEIKKLSFVDDLIAKRNKNEELELGNQRIIYNLGLAVHDLYYALKIYELFLQK